jgi:hypothetical protein
VYACSDPLHADAAEVERALVHARVPARFGERLVVGHSRSVELTLPEGEDVEELQRRARLHLGLQATK